MQLIEIIGIVGASLLAGCAIPEVVSTVRKGYCGSSTSFIVIWLLGEILTSVYVIETNPDFILLANYSLNVILLTVLLYYKIRKPNGN